MGLFDKPRSVTIDLTRLKAEEIEYFCTTKHIDKIVAEKRNVPFNQDSADADETNTRHYFVVKTNREYDIIRGSEFEKWLLKNFAPTLIVSGEVADWNPKTETGKIMVFSGDAGAKVEYIEPQPMKLTAKAKVCRDHFILKIHGIK